MSRPGRGAHPEQRPERDDRPDRSWVPLFLRNVLLWLVPAWLVWALFMSFYNRFLLASAQNLLHLTEYPSVTQLLAQGSDDAVIARLEPPLGRLPHGFRVTDVHFHLVLLLALFLAMPRVPWRERLGHLGWALLITVFFDISVVFCKVKVAYATQLGSWSAAHYSPFARNAWGLLHHLLDLPFKLALPFALWTAFYLSLLLASPEAPAPRAGARPVR
ncbi:MAG TPA: hypothetical protein VGR07_13500 [Thermoanaerobaculia bacterium]|jgi:hypothetical protein|nr:hypothetical protein [Thermoanaerobaculia bacterium]